MGSEKGNDYRRRSCHRHDRRHLLSDKGSASLMAHLSRDYNGSDPPRLFLPKISTGFPPIERLNFSTDMARKCDCSLANNREWRDGRRSLLLFVLVIRGA